MPRSWLSAETLQPGRGPARRPRGRALLLVPSNGSRVRVAPGWCGRCAAPGAVVGPSVPWLDVASIARTRRAAPFRPRTCPGSSMRTTHLAALILAAAPDTRADLRAQVLAPLDGQRPSTVDKLTETLRVLGAQPGPSRRRRCRALRARLRPCAIASSSCGSCTATGWRIRSSCSRRRWRWRGRGLHFPLVRVEVQAAGHRAQA